MFWTTHFQLSMHTSVLTSLSTWSDQMVFFALKRATFFFFESTLRRVMRQATWPTKLSDNDFLESYFLISIWFCLVDHLSLFLSDNHNTVGQSSVGQLYVCQLPPPVSTPTISTETSCFQFSGIIGNTTRLFALNTLEYLQYCDRIVVMHEGRIHKIGTFDELKEEREGPFAELMRDHLKKKKDRTRSNKGVDRTVRQTEPQNESITFLKFFFFTNQSCHWKFKSIIKKKKKR